MRVRLSVLYHYWAARFEEEGILLPHPEMKSCTFGVSRYSLQLLQYIVEEPPTDLNYWMLSASTY